MSRRSRTRSGSGLGGGVQLLVFKRCWNGSRGATAPDPRPRAFREGAVEKGLREGSERGMPR
eukprot:12399446-Alexandrium_andersonii.AAC.1